MIEIIKKEEQAQGYFNNGEIIENKPVGFPQDGGKLRNYANLFYWAHAEAKVDSTIGLHPHRGFEIMSIVLKGTISHYDTLTKAWTPLSAGDVQLIQSGSGVAHSERIHKDSALFQIWFDPDLSKSLSKEASYQDYDKSSFVTEKGVRTIVGKNSPISLDSQVEISEHRLNNEKLSLALDSNYYYSIYLYKGSLNYKDTKINSHDFIRIAEENLFEAIALEELHFFCIKSPMKVGYRTF
jgi:redox-sensitive bicupin YhaK (pirin superfamily)